MSLSGSSIARKTAAAEIGDHARQGTGAVVRNWKKAFALEFVHEQLAEALEESVTAR